MKQGFKKILGSVMSSAMMLSMISSMGIVTQASSLTIGTLTLDITSKMDVYNGGAANINYFRVKGIKDNDSLEVTGFTKKKHIAPAKYEYTLPERDDQYPLEVTANIQVKPEKNETINSIRRIDVSDALQYCYSVNYDNTGLELVASESQLKPNTYCFMNAEKTEIKVDFMLVPYVLKIYNSETNANVREEWFYGVAGTYYLPKYSDLLPKDKFPLYRNNNFVFKGKNYPYSTKRFVVGGGEVISNAQMEYWGNTDSDQGVFGGFGYPKATDNKYQIKYQYANSYQVCYSNYQQVCETITFNAYVAPRWEKKEYAATCEEKARTVYKDKETGEEHTVWSGYPLGHNYVHKSENDIPGTVTKPAQEYWECTKCHDYEYREGAKATTKEGKIGEFDYVFDNKNDAGVFTIDDVLPIEIPDFPGTPAAPFEGFSSLVKKIVFKSGKTTAIGDSAFSGLDNSEFTSVSLPANVTRIGDYAFMDSKALKNVTFNGDNLEEIGTKAFFGTSVKEVTIPKSVKTIGAAAFGYEMKDGKTTEVKGFKIKGYPGTEAEKYAKLNGFEFVDLTKAAPTKAPTAAPTAAPTKAPTAAPTKAPTAAPTKAPANTTTPAATTAPNATVAPTTVPGTTTAPATTDAPVAPAEVTADGQSYTVTGDATVAFAKPETATDKVTIPDSITVDGHSYKVTAVNDNAFKNDKTITEVVIGKNVKTIGNNAFSGCTKLKKVTGAASVTKIGNAAFKNCKALTKITIGKKIKEIGKNAFSGCKKLSSITVKSKVLKTVGKNAFKSIAPKAVFKLPKKKFAAEKKLITASKVAKTVKFKKG